MAYLNGRSVAELAFEYEVSEQTIYGILRSAGVALRVRGRSKSAQRAAVPTTTVAEDYLNGYTIPEIARARRMKPHAITYALWQEGIKAPAEDQLEDVIKLWRTGDFSVEDLAECCELDLGRVEARVRRYQDALKRRGRRSRAPP